MKEEGPAGAGLLEVRQSQIIACYC
jgi:hypothetical protein